jgi:enoyl-[acyl-carrier protein] reductase II
VIIAEKVPVVNYALGKGDWLCQAVHEYGGKVIATVATAKHALAAQRDGADALIVTGHEAAGHGGDVTSMVLIPTIADQVQIPIIAAGGIADGRGLVAALALGAEGVAMGTRFMNTVESPVHEAQKKISCEKDAFDTVYTDRVDGMPARLLNTKGARRIMGKRLNPLSALLRSRQIAKMLGFPWLKLALGILGSGYSKSVQMARMAVGFEAFQRGSMEGDNERGVLPLGQVTGLIRDTPHVAEIMQSMLQEAEQAYSRMATKGL